MNILLTNDDGYRARGIKVLSCIMKKFGNVTVIAPENPQSGMSMAVSMGKRIAYRELGTHDGAVWSSLDATPASCVKFAMNTVFSDRMPDVVVSGINHGSNAATAVCYSGTLGAAAEAAVCGIPSIGVSLDSIDQDADFSAVEKFFPDIFRTLFENMPDRYGIYYNVNFPSCQPESVKGIKIASQGMGRWIREFRSLGKDEDGAGLYSMTGEFTDDSRNPDDADHRLNSQGYVTIVPLKIDCTDYSECTRLRSLF